MADVVVLHGSWMDGALHLWAERWSAEAAASRSPMSPYDPGPEGLLAAFRAVPDAAAAAGDLDVGQQTAWLPTVEGRPVHSREVWQFTRAAPRGAALAPWQVSAMALSWREQFALLGVCRDNPRLAPGVVAGQDLMAWAELFRYAGALVARTAFLPALVTLGTRYESRWQPAFDGKDRQRLYLLAARLPSAARCLAVPDEPFAAAPAADVAAAFVAEIVDRLVRFSAVTTLSRAHASKGRYFSAHDAWIAALRGDGRIVRWDEPGELAALSAEIQGWRRPVDLASRADWRLMLRLEEPGKEGPASWFLRYLVQPLEHPEAVQPLASAWCGSDAAAADRGELALTSLGQAATLCPLLGRANGAQATAGCHLTTGEAYEFLTVYAPLIEASGFGVVAPAWWQGTGNRPRIELIARAACDTLADARPCSLASLVAVDWQIALGGEAATIEELEQLAQSGEKLVRFRDRWIEFDSRQVDEALRLWRRRKAEARSAGDIVRMMIGIDQEAHGLRVGGVQARGWIQDLVGRLRGETALEELPPPQGFCGALRPYQQKGFAWLAFLRGWGLGACLADDMGLGKTVQTLALLAREQERGEKRPVLLVCPGSVIGNWQRESARFTPDIRVLRHHGPDRLMGDSFVEEAGNHTLVVTNYALLPRDYATLRRVSWAGVVLDEAQNIKNPDTRQSQAARALTADYRLALTGTPVENHVGDLWSIMDFLNPGLLGTRASFRDRFLRPIQSGVDPAGRDRLRRATGPFVLRRLKTDRTVIADLPEKIEGRVYCPLTREQAALYAAVLHELETALADTRGIARRGLVLATLTRLKQICNHPANYLGDHVKAPLPRGGGPRAPRTGIDSAHAGPAASPRAERPGHRVEDLPNTGEDVPETALDGRSGKLDRLCEMLEEVIASGEHALVFTQFARMGGLLQSHIGQTFGFDPLFLHGGVPLHERDRMVAAFQSGSGPPVFVLSLRAGGTGLNLARANHVFHFDRWWNPAVENQATDRAFRIGQTRNVMVHKFICAGTLEDRIDAMITAKTAMAEEVVGSGEAWLTDLSDDELKHALALAPGAVMEDGREEQ
jgi:hypothetical protein